MSDDRPKLTEAQQGALEAVRDGKIRHWYHRDGNQYRCPPGVGARAVWALERMKLIQDGRDGGAGVSFFCSVGLTDAGRKLLGDPRP